MKTKITKDTFVTRIDGEGSWENETNTIINFLEWFAQAEYDLDKIDEEEYEKIISEYKNESDDMLLLSLENYGESYGFYFLDMNGKIIFK